MLSRLSDSAQGRRGSYFQVQALYLGLRTSYGVNTMQIYVLLGVINTFYKQCHA